MTKHFSTRQTSGFTLIELLVVISLILVASSIIISSGGGGTGAKLSTAQRVVSGVAQGARGQAILKGADTRLIIYSEKNTEAEPDKILRFLGIVYQVEERDPSDGSVTKFWKAATQGTYLPEGIYFDPDLSDSKSDAKWSESDRTMSLDYPRRGLVEDGSGSEEFYYYEFNSNGTMAADTENSWLVFRSGTLKPNESDDLTVSFPKAGEEGESLRSALIFRRVGTTTPVTEPADIVAPADP